LKTFYPVPRLVVFFALRKTRRRAQRQATEKAPAYFWCSKCPLLGERKASGLRPLQRRFRTHENHSTSVAPRPVRKRRRRSALPAHSKTLHRLHRVQATRQRLGLRQPSGAFSSRAATKLLQLVTNASRLRQWGCRFTYWTSQKQKFNVGLSEWDKHKNGHTTHPLDSAMTTFIQLNHKWNAEPNAPNPRVVIEDGNVVVSFLMNPFQFPQYGPGDVGRLRFSSCIRYRLGSTNDEGWYRGQCRFSKIAPRWGEFYEISGDLRLAECPDDWVILGPPKEPIRHFLFYFRDETFECDASDWKLDVIKG
jgi:hypothetical protein